MLATLVGCGGNGNTLSDPTDAGAGTNTNNQVALIELVASNTQLGSAPGAPAVTLTAQAKDSSNAVIEGSLVQFSASSGSITVTQATTDALGQAIAELGNGLNSQNRDITVTASVTTTTGTVQRSIIVSVTGTRLRFISGPSSLALDDTATYNFVLEDSASAGIAGEVVNISSALSNSLSTNSLLTDSAGAISVDYTADNAGDDTLSASALGESAGAPIAISDDSFAIAIENDLVEIPLNTPTDVIVTWISNAVPVVGSDVDFATTRGVLTPTTATTVAGGIATVSIQSVTAGPATINATGQPSGPTTSTAVEFVATIPANLDLQTDPLTVGTGEQATITATVTDANGNPVKNQTIDFSILLDPTGGSLASPTSSTDSQGRANTVYTAGGTPSAQNGVEIQATVRGTAIIEVERLTVARAELFISLGTGNDLFEPNSAQFRKEWVVQVTDADGNAVSGTNVQVSINSLRWIQGCYVVGEDNWVKIATAICNDEDVNRNGVLDTVPADEDTNANGRIEAGNIALVAAQGGGAGQAANVVTDNTGSALVDVLYPQSYHGWVEVEIEAKASVAGTETRRTVTFVLDAKADDITNVQASPPGRFSPFGRELDGDEPFCTTFPEQPQGDCPELVVPPVVPPP
jgi:hypothetical protein